MTRTARAPKASKRARKPKKLTRGKMGKLADKLFSLIVRSKGPCHACPIPSGVLQCAHIVSRSYRSTRWDEENAVPLCAGCHVYYTHHSLEWEEWVTLQIGPVALACLKARALKPWDKDLEGVLVRLAARAVALGIEAGQRGVDR